MLVKNKYNLNNSGTIKMGLFYSKYYTPPLQMVTTSKYEILLNQAYCHKCNSVVLNKGLCKCRNVKVFGEQKELGRLVLDHKYYSDCSLLSFTPTRK